MKTFLLVVFAWLLGLPRSQAQQQQVATGSLAGTSTGVICSLTTNYADTYTVIIDGESLAGLATAQILTLVNPGGLYEPVTTPALGSLAVTSSTLFIETIPGPLLGLEVSLTAHISGTVVATIIAN
jgi:hypothetical protein